MVLLAVAGASGALRGLPRRAVVAGLAMGAIGYATQSGLFFGALERMDASLLALILYVYPALVLIAAVALGRERASARRVAALLIALAGHRARAAGRGVGQPRRARHRDGLRRRGRLHDLHPRRRPGRRRRAAARARRARLHGRDLHVPARLAVPRRSGARLRRRRAGSGSAAIALVSTVGAIVLFFAGLARVGPSAASILSTLEPVVTVALAAAAFGESLSAVQLLGGALVLGAVVVMQWPARPRARVEAPALAYGGH